MLFRMFEIVLFLLSFTHQWNFTFYFGLGQYAWLQPLSCMIAVVTAYLDAANDRDPPLKRRSSVNGEHAVTSV